MNLHWPYLVRLRTRKKLRDLLINIFCQFIKIIYIFDFAGIFLSTTLAAPWVVLDSRNDMLAMSSEVSDSVMTYALPPAALNTPEPSADEASVQITSTTPENIVALNDDIPVTTEVPLKDEPVPAATTELNQEEELKLLDEAIQEIAQSTTQKSDNGEEEVQNDLPEVTTMATLSSSSSPVDSLFQQDEIPSGDMMDMDMEIKFSDMGDMQRKNPNSIEEDEPLMSVVVVSKKKHEIFSKKSKYHM